MARIEILGVKIDKLSLKEALSHIKIFLKSENQYYITTPNPEFIVKAQRDQEFRQILNFADLSLCDGFGIVLASWLFGKPITKRITGNDIVWQIINLAEQKKYSIYLLGGQEGIAQAAAKKIRNLFSNDVIAGAESGGDVINPKQINPQVIERINSAKPDILLVAFGHSKQEKFIYYNLDKLKTVKVAIGIGGVLDFISGTRQRAPGWMRKTGLEWLYRLLLQPQRLPRIINAVIIFPWLVIINRLNYIFSKIGFKNYEEHD